MNKSIDLEELNYKTHFLTLYVMLFLLTWATPESPFTLRILTRFQALISLWYQLKVELT